VLSTRIAANIFPLSASILADLAISSARQLKDGRDGVSYLMDVKTSGIETPLLPIYEKSILEKTDSADLAAALMAFRKP
jgi:hypothetical protein